MPTRRSARNQKLPLREAEYLESLVGIALHYRCQELYAAGWTFRAIGEALNPPRGKSTVHAWVSALPTASTPATPSGPPVPSLEYATPATYIPKKPKAPPISHADAERLRDLTPSVRRFRSPMSKNHQVSLKIEEFSQICQRLHDSGVPIQDIADICDVSYNTISKRLTD